MRVQRFSRGTCGVRLSNIPAAMDFELIATDSNKTEAVAKISLEIIRKYEEEIKANK